jgi:hypothetical protein
MLCWKKDAIILLRKKKALPLRSSGLCLSPITEMTEWKRKSDPIFEIIELLDDKAVKAWESSYYNNEDAYYEDED